MPDEFRRKVRTEWADANRPGAADRLLHRRARHSMPTAISTSSISRSGASSGSRRTGNGRWSSEYDGWPNGLKIGRDGRILVADYRHGIMELDARAGRMQQVLTARNSESFKRLQRPAYRRQRRHLFHRPGADRPARSDRAGLSARDRRPARLPDRYRHQPQRPGARSQRDACCSSR